MPEKEEEAGLRRDRGANNGGNMYHSYVVSSPLPNDEVQPSQHRVVHNQ